jgi:hypothetical protein
MNFLHSDFIGGNDFVVLVTLDGQANVLLLDDGDFAAYRNGQSFHYYGGWQTQSPVRLSPPHYAHWHVIIDRGGHGGTIRAGIRIIHTGSGALA